MAVYDPTAGQSLVAGEPAPGSYSPNTTEAPADPLATKKKQIADAYQQYLGRAPQEYEYGFWTGNPNAEQGIASSPEAKARAQGQTYTRTYDPMAGYDQSKLNAGINNTKYNWGRATQEYGLTSQNLADVVNYFNQRYGGNAKVLKPDVVDFGEGYGPVDVWNGNGGAQWGAWWDPAQGGNYAAGIPAGGANGGSSAPSAAGSAFSDPATSQWEQLLRNMVTQLNTPVPAGTQELQQTQALDPLERLRQQQKDQMALRLSQRGISPNSGIFTQAMADIDRQFNEARTRTQATFATNAATQEENRMAQAVDLFKQIPQYQDTRLALANSVLTPANPAQLLNLQQQYQNMANQNAQYNNAQNQQFWQWLGTVLADAFNK